MKNVMFISIIILSGLYAQAQNASSNSRYGIKLAAGYITSRGESDLMIKESELTSQQIKLVNPTTQYSAGIWGQKQFGWLYAEANAMYSTYGMTYNVSSNIYDDVTTQSMSENFGYIDLQVMGGLMINGFRFGVGPVAHIMANHSTDLTHMDNYNEKMRSISYGFSTSVGYNFDRFSIDLRFDKAFRTIGDHIYYGYRKSRFRETPDALTFSVAYALIR